MQNNAHFHHLRPGPDCASFAYLLPLLSVNAPEGKETTRLYAHLATCAYCQTQRAVYDRIDVALRRTFSAQAALLLSPEDMIAMTNDERWSEAPAPTTPDRAEPMTPAELADDTLPEASFSSVPRPETVNKADGRRRSSAPRTGIPASPQRRLVSLHTPLAVVAAVLVVGLLAATFAVFSLRPSSSVGDDSTPTPSPTEIPQRVGSWSPVANLTTTTTVGNALPAIAPGDPHIVYEITDNPHPALRRTADGGATWQPLPLPVQNAANELQLYVSPLNPNVVVLHTDGYVSQPSPCSSRADAWLPTAKGTSATRLLAARSQAVPSSGNVPCAQFLSTDGGRTWTQTSDYFDNFRIIQDGSAYYRLFMVQGNRLYTYADFTCQKPKGAATYVCTGGLLVSMDGGMTWRSASTPSPQTFCGLALAPTGTVMFVITSAQCEAGSGTSEKTIWRSDDAGAHWAPVSHLQFGSSGGTLVIPSAGATYPTLYLKTSTYNPPTTTQTFQMSQDGGKTWSVVPTTGIPAGWLSTELVGQTSDGSPIGHFASEDGSKQALYSWRPGAARWQFLAPVSPLDPTTYRVIYYLETLSPAGHGDTLWEVSELQKQQGSGLLFTDYVYRLQL